MTSLCADDVRTEIPLGGVPMTSSPGWEVCQIQIWHTSHPGDDVIGAPPNGVSVLTSSAHSDVMN